MTNFNTGPAVTDFVNNQYPRFSTVVQPNYGTPANTATPYSTTIPSLTTAGAITLTAAQLLGGFILRDPNGAARSDVFPTAALLVAAMNGVQVGVGFEFTIRNFADAAETITMVAGTGGTVSGTATIAQNNAKRWLVVITNASPGSEAYTVYSLGTVTF